jgi:hypothetical protein
MAPTDSLNICARARGKRKHTPKDASFGFAGRFIDGLAAFPVLLGGFLEFLGRVSGRAV